MRRKDSDRKNIKKATLKSKILKNKSKDRDSNFLVMFSSSKALGAIEIGEGMTHCCWPQFMITQETCSTWGILQPVKKFSSNDDISVSVYTVHLNKWLTLHRFSLRFKVSFNIDLFAALANGYLTIRKIYTFLDTSKRDTRIILSAMEDLAYTRDYTLTTCINTCNQIFSKAN